MSLYLYASVYGAESALSTEALLYVGQSLHLPELNIFTPKMRAAAAGPLLIRS